MRTLLLVTFAVALQSAPSSRRDLYVVHGGALEPALVESLSRRRQVHSTDASTAGPDVLAKGHLALIGTPRNNRFIGELDAVAGLVIEPDRFQWQGETYDVRDHTLQLRTLNPWNSEYSLELWLGSFDETTPRRRAAVQIRRLGKTVYLAFEGDDGAMTGRRFELTDTPSLELPQLSVFTHGVTITDESVARLTETAKRLKRALELHLYPDLETKGLITDDTTTAHAEGLAVHAVLAVDHRPLRLMLELGGGETDVGPLLLRRGRAALAAYPTKELDRMDRLAARLLRTSDPPDVIDLLADERFGALSPFAADAVSASFARFASGRKIPATPRELAASWARQTRGLALPERAPAEPPSSFHRGMTFAHQGYRIHDGYLSEKARSSLTQLQSLGVDAVAIVPYAFMPSPTEVVPLDVPTRPGSETDDDVLEAIRAAQDRGMTVMLKPQIWIRQSWPGDIDPQGPQAVDAFFTTYRSWIVHYAMLAESRRVPLLAVGTELSRLTGTHRAHWERLIHDVRCVFSGKIVYAANWGNEVENVVFWDLVDFIGVDFYYPLSFDEHPSEVELEQGFDNALVPLKALHTRYRKPVLFTEVGYASTKAPWRKPHASDKEPLVSPADQARAYEVALRSIADQTDWIRGMYWWKWPTTLERGGLEHRGFTPNGKPAADVLRQWYRGRLQ